MSFIEDGLTKCLEDKKKVLIRGAEAMVMIKALKPFIPEGMSFYPDNLALKELAEHAKLNVFFSDKSVVLWEGDLSTWPEQQNERLWYLQIPKSKIDDRNLLSQFDMILGFHDGKLCERIVHTKGDM